MSTDKNRRVLIIDDNRSIHDDFRKILCPATAGEEALDAAETEQIMGANARRLLAPGLAPAGKRV